MRIGPLEISTARKQRRQDDFVQGISRPTWDMGFSSLRAIPNPNDFSLYTLIRNAIPCVHTAINIYRNLIGMPIIVADDPLREELTEFLEGLRVNQFSHGVKAAQNIHVGNMLIYGLGAMEIVPSNSGKDIYSVISVEPETIQIKPAADSGRTGIYQRQKGKDIELDPLWLMVNLNQPENNPYGVSMLRSMAFVAEILTTVERELLHTWERYGTPNFHVSYMPGEGYVDPTGEKGKSVIDSLKRGFNDAMKARKKGSVRDFFSVGDITIKAIGPGGEELDFAVPYRSLMEQVAGATMLPSWMLGFTWSTTERLSRHQADLINTVVDGLREEMETSWRYLCAMWMAVTGRSGEFEITWDAISLLDATEQARADLMEAQAIRQREANASRLWDAGIYTQEQYAEHTLGEDWDGEIQTPLALPPAKAPAGGGFPLGFKAQFSDYPEASTAGSGEQPKSEEVGEAINGMYRDIINAAKDLKSEVFAAVGLSLDFKADFADPFSYTAEQEKVLDAAIQRFLTKMAGPDLSRSGFVNPGTPDGIIQEWDRFAYAIGLNRARQMRDEALTNAILPDRNSEEIKKLMDVAFERLSDGGQIRLEGQLGDIKSIIAEGMEGGQNPLDVARTLSNRFDTYERYEFARLARTEIAFAQTQGLGDQLQAEGVDMSAVDPLPPFHPNCLCDITVHPDNVNVAVYEVAEGTACPICVAMLDDSVAKAEAIVKPEDTKDTNEQQE